jgi:autotransporter-associated beta strand protein
VKVSALLPVAVLALVCIVGRAQVVTVNQDFKGTTAPGWTLGDNGGGFTPVLTASTAGGSIDPVGSGWLRLTSSGGNQATYAYDTTSFNAANATVAVKFDFATYNGTGADGITFFLADASKTFGVGAYGGSLGYAQKTTAGGAPANINGMNGGYLGVGVDEYGNYSNPTEGRVGGIGSVPNAIAVRGPGQGLTGYNYLGGTGNLGANSIAFPGYTTRPTGTDTRSVEMILTATNQLTVYMSSGGGAYVPLYSIDLSGYARPDQLIMGFTGSTGGSTDIHEIQNVSLSSVAANLWTNTGADSKWATGTDWHGGSVPVAGADVLLDNTYVNTAQTIDVGSAQTRSIRSLQIDAPFSYTLNNGTIEFNNNGILGPSGILVSQTHGSATQTINSNLIADNAIEIRNGSAGALNLTGTLVNNGNTVTFDGSGNTSMSGAISGAGGLVKNDAGTLTLSGANTYSGGTTLNTGTLTANNNSALGTGALTINGGALASTNSSTVNNTITLNNNAGLSGITTGGTLTQTGGSYTLNLANATQSGAVNLSEGNTGRTLTAEVDSGTSTISGIIANGGSGAGGLTKTGNGTLVLGGTNTYTGTTAINAGTVQLGGSNVFANTSSLNLGANGTLNLNGFSNQVGNLTAAGGATLDFGPQTGANTFVFSTYTAPTSGVLVVNNWQQGTDTLATTVAGQNVSTVYLSGYGIASENTTTSSTIFGSDYLLTPLAQTGVVWNGNTSANWGTGTNWTGNAAPTATQIAVFDITGAARTAVTLDGANSVAGLKFAASAAPYTISGANTLTLAGALPYIQQQSASNETLGFSTLALGNNTVADITSTGNLTINSVVSGAYDLIRDGTGAGRLILNGANTFTGGLFINNGIVQAGNTAALGTGATTISAGAALELNGAISPTNAISVSGTGVGVAGAIHDVGGTNTLSGVITETGDTTIAADTGATLNLTGNLTGTNTNTTLAGTGNGAINVNQITTGTGGMTVNGGTVNYNGTTNANTYTGTTTVNSGTLNLGKTAGTIAIAGNLTVNGGAVNENASNQIATTSNLTVNGGSFALTGGSSNTVGNVNSTSGSTLSLSSGSTLTINSAGNSMINGTVTGAGALSTQGTGNVTLAISNSYTGGSTLASVVTALNSGSLGTGAVAINTGGNLQVQNGINLANNFTLNSPGTSANDGAFQNVSGNNTISGTVTLAGNSRLQSDFGLLTLSNTVALGANTLNVGGAGNTTVSGIISGTGALTKDGAGTLTLSGANSYTGGTTINAGTAQLGASNVLAASSSINIAGGTLALNGYSNQVGTLSFSNGATIDFGSGSASNTLLFGNAGTTSGTLTINNWTSSSDTLASTNNALGTGVLNSIYFSGYGSATEPGATTSYGGVTGYILTPGTFLTWNGSGADNNWSTGADWVGGTAPVTTAGSLQKLDFTGSTRLAPVMQTDYSVNALKFDSCAGAFNINATGHTLTLNGTLPSIIQQSANNETITGGTVALGAVSVIDVSGTGSLAISSVVSGANGFTKLSGGTLTLSGANTYTGATTVSAGIINIQNATALGTTASGTIVASGATLQMQGGINVGAEALTLNGAGATGATGALENVSGTNTFGGVITLASNSTISSDSGALNLTNAGTIAGSGYNLTLAGATGGTLSSIIGTGGGTLTKTGAGTWTLSGVNTYTGATAVNAGILNVGVANAIGSGSDVTVASAGTLNISTFADTVGSIAGAGSLNLGTGALTAGADNASTTFSGTISGTTGSLTKNGTGTLILSGNNSYAGATTVSVGVLNIQNGAALGGTGAGTSVTSGATLQIQNNISVGAEALTLNGVGAAGATGALENVSGTNTFGGLITLGFASTISSDSGSLNLNNAGTITGSGDALTLTGAGSGTIASIIGTGAGTLTKTGTGTWTLSGANTYTGATTVSAGVLNIQNNTALGTTAAGTSVTSGATLQIQGGITVGAEALTLNGTGSTTTNGALESVSGTNSFSGAITLGSATRINSDSGSTLTLSGNIGGNTQNLTVGGAGNTVISGAIGTTSGTLTKDGAGTLTLTHANTYTGATTVSAGILNIQSATALGTNASGTTVASGATLQVQGGINVAGEALTLSGTGSTTTNGALENVSGNNTLSGAITMGSDTRINSDAGTLTLSGGITGTNTNLTVGGAGATVISGVIGTGTGGLTKDGTGSNLTLSAVNTYTGATTVSAGTLTVGIANAIGSSSAVTVATGGTLGMGTFSDVVGSIAGAGSVTLGTGSTLTAGGNNTSTSFSGVISGTGGLTKSGTGTFNLSGTNAYTGATTINAGTVQLGASNVFANTTNVSIAGGTLALNGNSDQVGNLLFSNGGTLDYGTGTNSFVFTTIGTSSGTLTINNYTDGSDYLGATSTTAIPPATLNTIYFSGYGSGSVEAGALSAAGNGLNVNAYKITPGAFLTWNGGSATDSNWSTTANWVSGTAPATTANSTQKLDFTGTTRLGPVMQGSYSVNVLKFDSGAGAFNITATGQTLTLSGTLPSIIQQSASNETITGGTVALGTGSIVDVSGAGKLTIGSVVSGTGTLTKLSGGTLILSGANTYTGATTVNGGVLSIGADNNLGAAPGTATAGDLTLNGGTLNTSATFTLSANRGIALGAAGGTIDVNNGTTLTYGGIIAGAGTLTKADTGTLVLSGANTYTGATTISGGILSIGADNNLGTAPGTATPGDLNLNGGTLNTSTNLTLSANRGIALGASGGTIDVNNATTLTYGGVIAGAGALTKADTGTLLLSGANTYTGATMVSAGPLNVGINNAIGSSSAVTVNSGATLNLNTYSDTVGSIAGGGSLNLGTTNASTLTAGGNNTSTTFSGVISGSGNLTKTGAGTLTLSGSNNYTGATNINTGTLAIGANGALSNTNTALTIAGGANLALNGNATSVGSLAGSGTITLGGGILGVGTNGASTTFSGSFASGDTGTFIFGSTGTLTLGSGMNLSAGTLDLNGGTLALNGTSSTFGSLLVTANSTIDFGTTGHSILDILGSVSVNPGVTLTITDWTDTADYFYSNNNPGATNLGRIVFSGYSPTATNWQSFDSEITPVPEPATYGAVLMFIGLSLGLVAAWRSRSKAPSGTGVRGT